MIVLFSHVRTGQWASVMPAKLAEVLGLVNQIRVIPSWATRSYPTIGLVVPPSRAHDAPHGGAGGRGPARWQTALLWSYFCSESMT
jgi:hypothetical protein